MGNSSKHSGGRPSKYDAAVHVPWARSLARLGRTDAEIAEALGVGVRTLYSWKGAHPEFRQALKDAKALADAEVVESLFAKACGKAKRTVKKKRQTLDAEGNKVELIEVTEETQPPDTTAIIYWLKNRQPELWRDKPVQDDTDTAVLKAAKELVSSVQSAIE